ncbi:putative baseplate assembly protein [Umezawaea sp.]|uniref:putative baseplate assembly protein n=1 Tax=Umezawaea sp. TaxID=1955258 RepID=UPI002ED42BD6
MTLPAPKLDDLTWADLMAAVRRRIPAESDGAWTLHAPVDPGVTLLELFAYLLEQRVYRLDQVPDELVVAILRLLGLGPPRPAVPAATVLQLTADRPGTPVPVLPEGTLVSRDPTGLIRFSLDEVAVFPVSGADVEVWTDRDRTADLVARRGVPLLGSDGGAASARFTLPLTGAHAAPGPLSLLVELDSPAPPSWSPRAVADVRPPADLTWSWVNPDTGATGEFESTEDGTAGLRRSGVVRLLPPRGWSTADRGVVVSTRAATYSTPPRLLRLSLNASTARHLERRAVTGADLADQITAWRKLPGQRLVLPDAAGLLLTADLRIGGDDWAPVADFAFGSSRDRVFRIDRTAGALVFGDGLTGRIPVAAPEDVVVEHTLGGGRAGNGGLTGNWLPVEDEIASLGVTGANLVQAADGADPETVAQARDRAAGALGEVTRAVTADDFATLATTTPGVAVGRAHAAVGEHPGFPCARVAGAVTVHVVPSVPPGVTAPRPDPGLLCEVADRLDAARLITTEVFVRAPAYREVRLRVDLAGGPADRGRVSAAVDAALRGYLDPLTGGDDGTGWPFGGALRPSALLRAAQRALGDLADVGAVAIALDGADPAESCLDVPLRAGELPAVREVRTRVAARAEPGEGLT